MSPSSAAPSGRASAPSSGRRRSRLAVGAAVVAVLIAVVALLLARGGGGGGAGGGAPLTAAPAVAVPAGLAFAASGIDGGGFQNVVAIDPFDPRVVLSGADVAGVARSADGGKSWNRTDVGLAASAAQRVAAILFNPRRRGEVYIAAGIAGVGGVWASMDDGVTWTLRSATPTFEGGRPPDAVQQANHPRFTGALLAIDPRDGTLYAGTFKHGVLRSSDDGKSWASVGLAGRYLRGMALDPANPDALYVGVSGGGVYVTRQARGAATFTHLAGSPADAEELRVAGGTVYVAGGSDGVFGGTANGTTWSRLGGGTLPSGPVWESIAVSGGGPSAVVYAGSYQPGNTGASVVRSTDGGRTFSVFLGQHGLHDAVGGPGGGSWWLLKAEQRGMPGNKGYIASDIALDPSNSARVLVAGRAGVWGTTDAGKNWYPLVRGLDVTITNAAVSDPNVPGRVYVALSDWTLVSSTDGLRTVRRTLPSGAPSIGWALAVDPSTKPSTVLLGAAAPRDGKGGEVYESADPLHGHWRALHLDAATGGGRPLGLAVGFAGGHRVVLAAVGGSGLWRRAGSGKWTKVLSGYAKATGPVPLVWPGGGDAYTVDDTSGLLRSRDAGVSWQVVWPHPGAADGLAVDPVHPDRGFASVGGHLFALSGLTGTVAARPVAGVPTAGPVTMDATGSAFVTSAPGDAQPRLFRSPAGRVAFAPVSAPAFTAAAVHPSGLLATRAGRLIITLRGTGALVGAAG